MTTDQITTSVAGSMSVSSAHGMLKSVFGATSGIVAITSNLALTVYATLFLTIRLLAHRKLLIASQGGRALTKQPLRIITILLESAAVNIPIVTATAVGLRTSKTLSNIIGYIVPPSQVCAYWFNTTYRALIPVYQALASVLVIHQVALGRAFDQLRELDRSRAE